MPPRFAYWTILIDNAPTAFRAQYREELMPTFHQLKRTNKDVTMKWFARGRLWESPDEARSADRSRHHAEKRDRDWRPGSQHKDPRAQFATRKPGDRRSDRERDRERPDGRPERPPRDRNVQTKTGGAPPGERRFDRPKPSGERRFDRPKPGGERRFDRPRPGGERRFDRPKPGGERRFDRPKPDG